MTNVTYTPSAPFEDASNKPRAVIYDKEVWIVVDEIKDEERHHLIVTNKGLNGRHGWAGLLVNASDTSATEWDCGKFCDENGIKWKGE